MRGNQEIIGASSLLLLCSGILGSIIIIDHVLFSFKDNTPREDEDHDPIDIVMMYKDGGILSNVIPEYLGEWAAEKIRCQGVKMMPKSWFPSYL